MKNENIDKLVIKAWHSIHNQDDKKYLMLIIVKIEKELYYDSIFNKLILLDPYKKNHFTLYVDREQFEKKQKKYFRIQISTLLVL